MHFLASRRRDIEYIPDGGKGRKTGKNHENRTRVNTACIERRPMISLETIGHMLDEIAESLPQEIYEGLSGGVVMKEEVKHHPKGVGDDLYILGEYIVNGAMGRHIAIYGGSFQQLYGKGSEANMRRHLEKTLKHEFVHHLESRAGEYDLEVEDALQIQRYRDSKGLD